MSDEKLVMNQDTVEGEAVIIANAKQCMDASTLSPTDSESTIGANQKGQDAFTKAQDGLESLGSAVDQEVSNIRSLGLAFVEFDSMIAEANRNQ